METQLTKRERKRQILKWPKPKLAITKTHTKETQIEQEEEGQRIIIRTPGTKKRKKKKRLFNSDSSNEDYFRDI